MHSYGVYERAVGSGKHTDDQVTQWRFFGGDLCVFPDRMFCFVYAIPPLWKERGSRIFWNRARSDRIGSDQITMVRKSQSALLDFSIYFTHSAYLTYLPTYLYI